ncbi:acylglycerol kinase, mitochondrial [Microplitis demolitor]|uniref:acylglycerol kinase, mitochondrial n=1 Tax=Microplitis demolitor TaxID=69319 RepID=UPI0004CD8891|nr:acylglycerol kinase, mitochondrial [Microplitis demolitor]XP_008558542.1 acylglycerol kinase, mitochondrial [Microplitis demolitor]XP_008558543.1 acylglycerol kinase, mitochondrial [Microplitis demolitor]XP_008558544.1 acylglycerol kinase, mitochondrial [Microplitis demolitor]XP_053593336.1 acylglycerol kinase, mitochondrial [Microplitis demolitor]XP_053593337.1 acylglycerol kinase, mitochondrial [Microplitis demolitor]XP_053593338.1 acylglycerol kinase, mitochondrial [Microplitis demolito
MSRVIKFFNTIKNNWKKSVVGAAALAYGVSYANRSYQANLLMTAYCKEAVKYGDEIIPPTRAPRHITIILNPVARKRKAKKLFEKYCEPLFHLAGIAVTILQTEKESQARQLIENLNTSTDGILVAGGDGTLLDVVTGLMRKCNGSTFCAQQIPIGILPLGEANRIADSIFGSKYDELPHIRQMIDASMAAVRGNTKSIDVVKVEPLEQDEDNLIKPIYALSSIELGAWRDADSRRNKYWYWGSLRRYVTYVFNGFKNDLNWNCNATIRYTDPCPGCSKCYQQYQSSGQSDVRWWHVFIPKKITFAQSNQVDYSKVKNDDCDKFKETHVATTELSLVTNNLNNSQSGPPAVKLQVGPEYINYFEFVTEGWRRIKGENKVIKNTFEAKEIEFLPDSSEDSNKKENYFSIDNEEFELRPMKIKLIPNAVKIFCP